MYSTLATPPQRTVVDGMWPTPTTTNVAHDDGSGDDYGMDEMETVTDEVPDGDGSLHMDVLSSQTPSISTLKLSAGMKRAQQRDLCIRSPTQ